MAETNGKWKAFLAVIGVAGALTTIVGNAYGDLSARLDAAQDELGTVRAELAATSGAAANLRVENAKLEARVEHLEGLLGQPHRGQEGTPGQPGGSVVIIRPPKNKPPPNQSPSPKPQPSPATPPTCLPAVGICI